MNDLDKLRQRVVELEVAAKEGLQLIEWFEGWLNNREDPVRYDPIGLQQHPIRYSVNYDARGVARIKKFMQDIIEDAPSVVVEG